VPATRTAAPLWWVRLTKFEYWNQWVFYVPIFFYLAWLMLRARRIMFFTAANPGIDGGGFIGESKWDTYQQMPAHRIPRTLRFRHPADPVAVAEQVAQAALHYPVVAKPDVGERGRGVERLDSAEQLARYTALWQEDFLVQEFIDWPFEAGVFYYRLPGEAVGRVSSIVVKEFLSVTGDGVSRLSQLIDASERARFQAPRLQARLGPRWDAVIPAGEEVLLEQIGNHSRGTKFVDGRALITPALTAHIDQLAHQVPGFWYGRFDLRAPSAHALDRGEFTVVELNGVISEPGHVYDPDTSLTEAYRSCFEHWHAVSVIARYHRRQGVATLPVAEAIRRIRRFFSAPQYGRLSA